MIDLNEIEILQIALVHEERARAFYEGMASRNAGRPAGDLFAFLAGEEEGHIRKLCARHGMPRFEAAWEEKHVPYLLDMDKLIREEGADVLSAPGPESVRRGLNIARIAEEHAIEFYSRAQDVVEDRNTKELLSDLEGEEKIHLARIQGYLEG